MVTEKKIDLVIILVVYKKRFKDISSIDFINSMEAKTDLELQTIIYDNSPETINSIDDIPPYITYIENKNNPGLATAYNYGLEVSINHNCEWMLLLDHDTELTTEYFTQVFELFEKNILTKDIVAVMPIVKASNRIISPVKTDFKEYDKPLNKTGKLTGNISGINSGTIVRVSFVKDLGGFNLNFPLDFLDHWFFNEVNKASKHIYVLDTVLQHDLSVLNFDLNINPARYNSILKSQVLFYKNKSFLFSARLKKTLFIEFIRHLIFTKDKKYALLTLKYFVESFK